MLARLAADELPGWHNRRKQVQLGEGHLAARVEADRQKQKAAARLTALGEAQHWEADTVPLRREVEFLSARLGEAQRAARGAEQEHAAAVDLEQLLGQTRARRDALLTLQQEDAAVQLLADQDNAYCATNPASPRIAKTPITATGMVHSGSLPPSKLRSSNGFIMAGISGSVRAPRAPAAMATAMPHRLGAK